MSTVGDTMSTAGGYHEYTGGYHDECGGYHEYTGGCSVQWGFHTNSIRMTSTFIISSCVLKSPIVLHSHNAGCLLRVLSDNPEKQN